MLTSMVHIFLVSIIITLTAVPFFEAGKPLNWGYFVLILFLTAFTMASIGMLIGVVSPNSRSIVLFSQAIFLPSMILGGLMVPSDMLPPALYRISLLLPTSYAMNAWKGLAFGMTPTLDPRWSYADLACQWDHRISAWRFIYSIGIVRIGRVVAIHLLGLLAMLPYVLGAIFLFS